MQFLEPLKPCLTDFHSNYMRFSRSQNEHNYRTPYVHMTTTNNAYCTDSPMTMLSIDAEKIPYCYMIYVIFRNIYIYVHILHI